MLKLLKTETRKLVKVFWHPTFLYLTIVGNGILILAVTAVYFLERGPDSQIKTYFDSLWWGISTITTVAYGDKLPQTMAGRLIGIILMYTGTVLFISFTGVLMMILARSEVERELSPIEKGMKMLPPDWNVSLNKSVRRALLPSSRERCRDLPTTAAS